MASYHAFVAWADNTKTDVYGHLHAGFRVSYGELGQRHEAHQVVPHTVDVLQELLQLLGAHGCCLDAQLHSLCDAVDFHHA